MAIEGQAGVVGVPSPTLPIVLYSRLEGTLLRTTVNARGGNTLRTAGSVRLSIGGSAHPMAQTLHRLGMDGASPLSVLTTHRFQSRLNAGASLGPLAATAETATRS
jgi:hypothetical protein